MELSPALLEHLGDDDVIDVPGYDRTALRRSIVHVGVGGFGRSHLATYVDDLCRGGDTEWGIVGVGVLAGDDRMAAALQPQGGLYTLLVRGEGATAPRVVGSLVEYVHAHPHTDALASLVAAPATAIVSLTVTEAGYPVDDHGEFDAASRNAAPDSAFAAIVAGLARRRELGLAPVTVLSCDNVVGNGDTARRATLGLARTVDAGLAAWIDAAVTFPNSMVDRITPATTDADRDWLADTHDVDDAWPVVCEPFRQWVVEDRFAAARLPLERLDVIVTDDVEPYEMFKLRLLNAGHSVLAYAARLAGLERVDEVMQESVFVRFLTAFFDAEAGPVVPHAPGIDLDGYTRSLVERFSNPAIGDQVDRLCQDGTAKIPTFVLPTVRDQLARDGSVRSSAFAIAAWCQYLGGTDDDGRSFTVAGDPNLDEARRREQESRERPAAFLELGQVFGDLADDPRFREPFVESLGAIRERGVVPAMTHLLEVASS